MKHLLIAFLLSATSTLASVSNSIRFSKGDTVALETFLSGELFESLPGQQVQLVIKRDLYLQVTPSEVLISLDGLNFKSIPATLGGEIEFGVQDSQDKGRQVQVGLTHYLK